MKFYSFYKSGTINVSVMSPEITFTQGAIGQEDNSPYGLWNGSFSDSYWGTEVTGSSWGYAYVSINALWIGNYDSQEHSLGYTKQPYDLTGVYQIDFLSTMGGDGDDYFTVFETDSDQTWPGYVDQWRKDGPYGLGWNSLNVARRNEPLYLKFGASPKSGGADNPLGWIENITFKHTFYKLHEMTSPTAFQRTIYDYSELNGGKPKTSYTYWDNPNATAYTPGVSLHGTTGFYTSDSGTVFVTPDPQAEANGLSFQGVWLCRDGNLQSAPTGNCYYIAAQNGMVSFQTTQEFVRDLINANVINSSNGHEENILVSGKICRPTL